MKRLEDLREVANETLAGLEAGPALRRRIQTAAAGPQRRRMPVRGLAVALSFALILAVALPFALRGGDGTTPGGGAPDMNVMAAGGEPVGNETASMKNSQVTITEKNRSSAYGLWDADTMLRVEGRYYRMLRDIALPGGELGGTVAVTEAQVSDLTQTDAAVAGQGVPEGTEIHSVRGEQTSAMVACEVDGQIRVFQRVSYAGNGLIGSEGLRDVMPDPAHVTALSLTGYDVVEGEEARRIYGMLLGAEAAGSGSVTARQVLLIVLDGGAVVQLAVNGDRLGGCGVWYCPELVEAMTR